MQKAKLCILRLATLCGVCSGLAVPAHAQTTVTPLLNQYIPPDVYGPDEAPGVTVTSRAHADYDPVGIHAGDFMIRPFLNESAGYESNLLGTSTPKGSALVDTNGGASIGSDWTQHELHANVNVDDLRYLGLPRQSYTNWSAEAGGRYDFGRDSLSVDVTHLNLNETPLDLDVPVITQPVPYTVDAGRVAYRAVFSRLAATPTLQVAQYSFSNGTFNGISYPQSYRNRLVVTPGVTLAYEVAPRRNLVFVVNDASATYSTRAPGQALRNYNDLSVLGGFDYELTGALRTRVLVGYEMRQYSAAQYSTIQAPIVEATVIWTPTGLTTVTGTAARRIEDANDETIAGYTETSGQIRIDHELQRNLLLRVNGAIYHDAYNQGGGTQTLWAAGVGVTRLVNRNLQIALTYDYLSRQSASGTVTAQNFSAGYADHRILLQLRLAL